MADRLVSPTPAESQHSRVAGYLPGTSRTCALAMPCPGRRQERGRSRRGPATGLASLSFSVCVPCCDDHERTLAATWSQGFDLPDLGQGVRQRLPPGVDREAGLEQKLLDLVSLIELGLAIKYALGLVRQVLLPKRAFPVDETDHQPSARLEHPLGLGQHLRG